MTVLLVIGDVTDEMSNRLAEKFTIHRLYEKDDPALWIANHGSKISYIATNGHDGVKPAYIDAMPNLKVISCHGVGYDEIDTQKAVTRGIAVTHTPNVLNAEVATTALLLTLACYRNFRADEAHVRSGDWEIKGNAPLSRSADNQTVGILGLGRIGQSIADKFAPFNPKIVYHARNKKKVDYTYYDNLVEMAEVCDVLICVTPGGSETCNLVGEEVLNALGSQGTLVNVSRGSVVDETALIAALTEGRLGWAGLDVFAAEPKVPTALRSLNNVVLLPHVGSATKETRAAMGNLTVDNLLQHLRDGTVISPVPECAHL